MKGLLGELNRRNVFRVAVTYAVAAWIVAQVAGLAADAFGAPPWVMQMIITALIVGFLPAVVVAWAFELTPEGIKRERELVDHETVSRYTAKRLDIAVIVLLLIAIALLIGDRQLRPSSPPTAQSLPPGSAVQADWRMDSIAVLPFADFSPNRDQGWLGEGIADTLLHALAQVEGLRVSARSSSFAYRERAADVATIGRELGVATVLEGSVQRAGDRLRVSARLVRTDTQEQVFSRSFDRGADDIFAIQDEIAHAVAAALRGERELPETTVARTEAAVYDLYLEGRQLWQERTAESVNRAVTLLQQAVAADPEYAPAHAELAAALLFQNFYANVELNSVRAGVERHIERALAIDESNALAWGIRGLLLEELGLTSAALDALTRAVALGPNDANLRVWLGNRYFNATRFSDAAEQFERALELDPLNRFVRGRFVSILGNINPQDPRIDRIGRDTLRLFGDSTSAWYPVLNLLANQNRSDELVLLAFEAHQRFPEEPGFLSFVASGLGGLQFDEAARRWAERARALDPEMVVFTGFQQMEVDAQTFLREVSEVHERWGGDMDMMYMMALRLAGELDQADRFFAERRADLLTRVDEQRASVQDYNLLVEAAALQRRMGRDEAALDLAARVSERLDEMRAELGPDDMVMADLSISLSTGDLAKAQGLLDKVPAAQLRGLAFSLRHDPLLAELRETPEARALLARAEAQIRNQRERLLAEAPPGLLEDS